MMTKELLFLLVVLGPICCQPTATTRSVTNQEQNVTQKQMTGEEHYYKANALAEQRVQDAAEQALIEYRKALENGYDTLELRIEFGLLLVDQLKQPKEAIEQLRIAIQRDENNWRAHFGLAKALLQAKEYNDALNEIAISERFDKESDISGFYAYYSAKAFEGLNNYQEALIYYEKFLERENRVASGSQRAKEVRERVETIRTKLGMQ
jgi:tetratricopeptide (TPR) repeat protein